MKRENFYRRDPGLALQGMSSMSLEERGVYNTVIDLLYLTWRPLEDDRGYIAGHCRCAVQKLNPIVGRLIAAGKLVRFEEDGRWYLSNPKFEDERTEIKGPSTTKSGRKVSEKSRGVEEISAGVSEKSPGVEDKPPLVDDEIKEKQTLVPLDRVEETKVDKNRPSDEGLAGSVDPTPPRQARKADVDAIWLATPKPGRERSSRGDIERALNAAIKRGHDPAAVLSGVQGYYASDHATKDGGAFAKGAHRLIENDRWMEFTTDAPTGAVEPWSDERWRAAVAIFAETGDWSEKVGPPPGSPDCNAPAAILGQFGFSSTFPDRRAG